MASEAQVNANRKNAQRSTGPRTVEGKSKVALNALSRGLTAVKVVAGVEDRTLFERLRMRLTREWRPGSVLEVMLVDRIAELIWQSRRVAGLETQVIERMPKWRMPGLPPELHPMAEAMARDLGRSDGTLLRVQLYQHRLERTLHRTLAELRKLQIDRQTQDEKRGDEFEEDENGDDLVDRIAIGLDALDGGEAGSGSRVSGENDPEREPRSPELVCGDAEMKIEKTNPISAGTNGQATD